jgi:uvrD/REP helicase
MDITSKLKLYAYHNIIAIDQLFNALTGGAADETLSMSNISWSHINRATEKTVACTLSVYQWII